MDAIQLTSKFDGVSQEQRLLSALQVNFVEMDEHCLKDQLSFAHDFAKQLKYFDATNVATGDWCGLINPNQLTGKDFDDWLKQIEDFIDQPQNYTDDLFYDLHRPHFVLFLTYLQLLKQTQQHFNQLTARHLEFYYRQVLNFNNKPEQPDRVNILVEPSSHVDSALLPKGTLLSAGKDSAHNDLVYETDADLIVNSIKIERLSSVFINKLIVGIKEAREDYSGTKNDSIIEMLKIALGDPNPGDALALYPPQNIVNFDLLKALQNQVLFVSTGLFMEIGELQSLILLKTNRGDAANGDWQIINDILSGPIQNLAKNSLKLTSNPRDFDNNIKAALKFDSLDKYFNTLTLVSNFTELYEQRTRQDVQDFMKAKNLQVDSFNQMMQIKVRIDNEWQEIYSILKRVGQATSKTLSILNPPDFDKSYASVLATPSYPTLSGNPKITSLDGFYNALIEIENYFFMPLEDFALLMQAATDDKTDDLVWSQVYQKLDTAYQKKVTTLHKSQLVALSPTPKPAADSKAAISMFQLCLGVPETDSSDLLGRIKTYLAKNTDVSLLENAENADVLSESDWDSVSSTLELAWRNRVPLSAPEKTTWLSLSALSDTSTAKAPNCGDTSHWRTFGQRQTQIFSDQTQAPMAYLGWAIESPMLCLAQGKRNVKLTLCFKKDQFNTAEINKLLTSKIFSIELTSEKGWLSVANYTLTAGDNQDKTLKTLCWQFELDEIFASICALPETDSSWPLLRLMLLPRWDDIHKYYVTDYYLFQSLIVEKLSLAVDVRGLTELNLQNDEDSLQSGKPFEPFGSLPAIGSRLYFSHSELNLKKIDRLDIHLPWMGIPNSNLATYYQNYTPTIASNSVFKAKVKLVDRRMELLVADGIDLFNAQDAIQPSCLTISSENSQISKFTEERLFEADTEEDVISWQRYWLLELSNSDFQHANYPSLAASKSIDLAAAITKGGSFDAGIYKLNSPYTPKLKSLTLDYQASLDLNLSELKADSSERVFHIHPFGVAKLQSEPETIDAYSFLPAYLNEGELYIGLMGVAAPETLTILLQMAEGSANPDIEKAEVKWSLLSADRWLDLDQGQLQADASDGLLQSGIVKLQLDEVKPSTLLPPENYWLRLSIVKGCDSVCDSIGYDTQAVIATFINQDNSEDHFNQPLAAESIKSLLEPLAEISEIKQPYTSFGARPKEPDSQFNTRVSERLRHKGRAVSAWDYERLVLEQFPDIYKVKCISAGDNPGQVSVIVIPDICNRLPFNPFKPKVQASLLAEIEEFLSAYASIGADIKVKNARFLPVKLRFAVRFQPGVDSSFYKQQLNDAINRFLSPWAYQQGKDLVIGGKIYANAIVNFIERQVYVDYVAYLTLFLGDEEGINFKMVEKTDLTMNCEGYAVATNHPDEVLVTAKNHEIDLITGENLTDQSFKGINYMKLELDFIVG